MNRAHDVLWRCGDNAQLHRVLNENEANIEPSFMGFLDIYFALAAIIPRGRVVYDLGCSTGVQAVFFRRHAGYVGVSDGPVRYRYAQANATHVQANLEEWLPALEPRTLPWPRFAILSYVPNVSPSLVGVAFPDHFTYYPAHGDHPEIDSKLPHPW